MLLFKRYKVNRACQEAYYKEPLVGLLTIFMALFLISLFFSPPVYATTAVHVQSLDWFTMFMWLSGGLALFLFGMEQMIKGLLVIAGNQIKNILARLTKNRVMGAITGAGVTAVIQSSSVTTVLTVGFVSAGLMTVTQAAGVIMGANLGTTVTVQIVAFKVTNYALLAVAFGFILQFLSKKHKTIAIGQLIMGLGLLFFGMNVMSEGMAPLRDYQPFLDLMMEMQNPFLGILVAFIFTALVQSSSATISVIIVMASNGFLTLPAGIALLMGANLGTTVTALLSTFGKSREALRTALIHTLFSVLGILIWLPFIPFLVDLAVFISSNEVVQNGLDRALLAEQTPREIANANTIFNLVSLILFLPLIPVFIWTVNKLVPILEEERGTTTFKAEFLDETFISTPSLALQAVTLEIEHYQKVFNLFYKRTVALIVEPDTKKLSRENLNIEKFRVYQAEILTYLGRSSQMELSVVEQDQHLKLMTVLHNLESMLDIIQSNIFNVLHEMIHNEIKPSETILNLVGKLTNEVGHAIDNALTSVCKSDMEAALSVISINPTIELLIQDALSHQFKRFQTTEKRLKTFRYEMQLVEGFKQIYLFTQRIAYLQQEPVEKSEVAKTTKAD
ncbi:Sodium-dependent phosphate transporter [hydrothermal vent metagenome]|uniref:Sodium-dependent phosphate transporter n=1 Tax=hydrothermal vent metagenome TaxID=652676 RepID=A0A3B0VYE5_9ZZZZ